MANLNKVQLIGRLTRDPELKHTKTGTPVVEVPLATNREFTTSTGEKKTESTFVDIVFWVRRAEIIAEFAKKGTTLYIDGRLELDQWEGPDGSRRSRLRVVAEGFQFLDHKGDTSSKPQPATVGVSHDE